MNKLFVLFLFLAAFGAVIFGINKIVDVAEVFREDEEENSAEMPKIPDENADEETAQEFSTDALDEILRRYDVSVYYENFATGYTYRHNADRIFFSASVPKAFYTLWVFSLAEKGIADLDSLLEFTRIDSNGGSGIIQKNHAYGTQFALRELLRLNISESDNVATLMLIRTFGIINYVNFVQESGGNGGFVRDNVFNSLLSANEAGNFARKIFEYIEGDGKFSREFKAALLDNKFPFITSKFPVASKTGWTAPKAWHEMAIVYAPSPFALVILSERDGWKDEDYADFAEISAAFEKFNENFLSE
ncbi:MAG: class A beta-lactamase-related serine hydrolase [Defluviitaleaceae bacterium]|nr:class A beta-lactamase-related serine hydrolase [Defluviitaleaceae bacterium]